LLLLLYALYNAIDVPAKTAERVGGEERVRIEPSLYCVCILCI